jgi:hypothetical protein
MWPVILEEKPYHTIVSTNTLWIWWQNSGVHTPYGMHLFGNGVKEQSENKHTEVYKSFYCFIFRGLVTYVWKLVLAAKGLIKHIMLVNFYD